jgi:hypothetical protein
MRKNPTCNLSENRDLLLGFGSSFKKSSPQTCDMKIGIFSLSAKTALLSPAGPAKWCKNFIESSWPFQFGSRGGFDSCPSEQEFQRLKKLIGLHRNPERPQEEDLGDDLYPSVSEN